MRKAVSPLIAFVITISLISVATTIVLTVIKPTFDRISDNNVMNEAMQNLELMNSAIKQIASESEGSKRTIRLTVSDGEYKINTISDYIYFDYETKTDYPVEGIIRNVRLDKSPVFIEYFNHYVENTNASPPWTIKNGTWTVESGEYSGQNGLAYYRYGSTSYFSLEGRITNKTGAKGEIFALPVSPEYLRGYWTFDEGAGNYSYDYSGFNNTGTLYNGTTICSGGNCPQWATGKFDYGLSFDGSNDYVSLPSIQLTSFTVTAWAKYNIQAIDLTVFGSTSPGEERRISIRSNGFELQLDGGIVGNNEKWCWINTGSQTANVWHHLVLTWDGTTARAYLDNSLVGSCTPTVGGTLDPSDNNAIGRRGGDSAWYMNGTIDEVKIYNRSLSINEIKSLYELGIKKLSSTGKSDAISATTDIYLVLSTPAGHTHFDEVKIKTNKRVMQLSIPYTNVDLNGTARFSKGNYQLTIEHKGLNTAVNKPIVELTIA